jgi:ATP-dependent exoDNAse (exonuclease V) beta subunit
VPGLPSAPTSFGQVLHGILEQIVEGVNLQLSSDEINSIIENAFLKYQHRFHPIHRATYKRYAKVVIETYLTNYPILQKPVYTEKYLTTYLSNGARINGFIDRVDQTNDGYHIIDYKSNKFAEKLEAFKDEQNIGNGYWKQGAIYKRLLKDNFPEIKTTSLSFDYLTLNKRVEFEDVNTEKFENWLSTIWEDIHSLNLKTSCSDQNCIYCKN